MVFTEFILTDDHICILDMWTFSLFLQFSQVKQLSLTLFLGLIIKHAVSPAKGNKEVIITTQKNHSIYVNFDPNEHCHKSA